MRTKRWLISLICLLLWAGSTLAQDATQPLILVKAGDLWEWTGGSTLRQKTQWGYNSAPIISPRNDEIAYSSYATITTDAIKSEGGFGGGSLPNNLWVITTQATDKAYRPANQPADASFMTAGVPDKALIRSSAMWSPDATQIAWAETDITGDGRYRLVIYDKALGTSRTVTSGLPPQYGAGAGLNGMWTEDGIVLFSYTANAMSTSGADYSAIIVDPVSGTIRTTVPLSGAETDAENLASVLQLPVTFQGGDWVMVLYLGDSAGQRWQLINVATGRLELAPHGPMAVSASHPTTSLQVFPFIDDTNHLSYNVYQHDGKSVTLNTDPDLTVYRFALSPDGQAIAYQLYNPATLEVEPSIYVWRNGRINTVPQTGQFALINEFVWGSTAWMLGGEG